MKNNYKYSFKIVPLILLVTLSTTSYGSGGGTNSSSNPATINASAKAATANCLSITNFKPAIGAWWVSAGFNLTNSCTTPQSASGLQLLLSAGQALMDSNFSLNNISFNPWAATTVTTAGVSGNTNAILITLNTTGIIAASSSISGSFGYNPSGVTLSGLTFIVNGGSTPPQQQNGALTYTLINPTSLLFRGSSLSVNISSQGSGSANPVLSQFGVLTTVSDLNPESYLISAPGLASASSGSYYSYPAKTIKVSSGATTAVGNLVASTVGGAVKDTITVNGLASGESVSFNFTDSKGYIFNSESLLANSASPTVGSYQFLPGDTITVNITLNNKYQSISPITITQGTSSQAFNLNAQIASVVTNGIINFHYYYGVSPEAPQDSLVLSGGNYNDLILSNMIAGVLYGHLISEYTPGIQFNRDYLYGSIFGQLLQENQSTQLYLESTNLLDPSYLQAGVFGVGQGGPYQINNYAADMVNGTYAPAGFSLINYIAIQGNIGYTMNNAGTQYSKATPPSFNNKYYGPLLTAYFHFNDYKALQFIGGNSLTQPWSPSSYSWTPQWQPYYYNSLITFKNLANSPLDILLNVAYNQGFYGTLFLANVKKTSNATASTVTSMNAYSNAWGTDTYGQYPYQVHNYLDQLYNNPTPSTSNLGQQITYDNHVAFSLSQLADIFSKIFQTLGYVNNNGQYVYISAAQANTAFTTALNKAGITSMAVLDLSNSANRTALFNVLEDAINILETNLGTNFSATTNTQIAVSPNL